MDLQCCQNLDDGELWLPSDFLSGESPPKKRVMHTNNINSSIRPRIPCEFPYEWNSFGHSLDSLSHESPVESVVGSTETESDEEDDYIGGLARQIADSMLDDDENSVKSHELQWANKSNTMARSPQSILSAVGSWSTGSSKGPSQVSSPPTTPMTENTDAWDLLYTAAGEVGRLNMDDGKQIPNTQGLMFGASSRQNISAPQLSCYANKDFQNRSCSFSGFPSKDRAYSSEALQRSRSDKSKEEDRKLLAHHYRQPKHNNTSAWARQAKPTQVQHLQDRLGNKPVMGNRSGNPVAYSSTLWPPLQQSGGSGMRAVFLGPNGAGRESGGTGVFLPRRVGNHSDLRRKPSCSTVLLPSRVVQALNLNVEDLNAQTGLQCGIALNYRDALTSTPSNPAAAQYGKSVDQFKFASRNGFSDQQNNMCYSTCPQIHTGQAEISLPQEWTY